MLSPGVPTDLPMVEDLNKDRDSDLGRDRACLSLLRRDGSLAITGTNGKTTTTALCGRDHGKLLPGCESGRQYRNSIYLRGCGHHRRDSDGGGDQQLSAGDHSYISTRSVSAILNITPDHLNRHHTMECYIKAKERITKNQTEDDVCVLQLRG